jgi:hypothetical protein
MGAHFLGTKWLNWRCDRARMDANQEGKSGVKACSNRLTISAGRDWMEKELDGPSRRVRSEQELLFWFALWPSSFLVWGSSILRGTCTVPPGQNRSDKQVEWGARLTGDLDVEEFEKAQRDEVRW